MVPFLVSTGKCFYTKKSAELRFFERASEFRFRFGTVAMVKVTVNSGWKNLKTG